MYPGASSASLPALGVSHPCHNHDAERTRAAEGENEEPHDTGGNQRGVVIRDDIPALLWTALLNKHFFITYLFSIKSDLDTNFGHLVQLGDSDKGNRGFLGVQGLEGEEEGRRSKE